VNTVTIRPRYEAWLQVPPKNILVLIGEKVHVTDNWINAQWVIENRQLGHRELIEDEWIAMRLEVSAVQLREAVVIDPQIRSGVPVLAGTRISISQIFIEIAEGETIYTIADEYAIDSDNIKKLFEGIATQFDRSFLK
jgi:uncharacterized protein (DUF433 family)